MADLKNKLFDYFAQRHFDLMSPGVRARFDAYTKNEDFQGHMKYWNEHFKGASTPDLVHDFAGGNDHKLTVDEWNNLYDAYQEVFQRMNDAKDPDIGFDSEYGKPVKDFIKDWFGPGKVFVPSEAKTYINDLLFNTTGGPAAPSNNLADFLDAHQAELKPIFTNKNNPILKDVFSTISYENFIAGLRAQHYNSDTKFREKLEAVIYYISQKMPKAGWEKPDPTEWPKDIGYTAAGPYVTTIEPVLTGIYANQDTSTWFHVPTRNIAGFQDHYTEIFDKLLTNAKIREKFLAQAGNNPIVTQPLLEAIKQTDYENKDSKDYLSPKYEDEKNWKQWLEDKLKDTYEDYFRKFVNPSRGTRVYFSPWAQDIIKTFDKVKIKPTDGLEGILAKKGDIANKLTTKTPSDHFKWFTDTLEKLKAGGMGKDIEGALRNGKQMRELVAHIIAEAVKQDKIKEAKTALEVLSVAKYGLLSSRTFDKLREATKNLTIVSDPKLSWNNNKGVAAATKAIDKATGAVIQGTAAVAMAAYNFVQHRRTKIDGDITKNKTLDAAHKQWNEKDTEEEINNADHHLNKLAAGNGKSGRTIDATTIGVARADLATMPASTATEKAQKEKLKQDIELYDRALRNKLNGPAELAAIHARQATRTSKDPFKELVAYWNMLETTMKTHTFTLGSMSIERRNMLKNYSRGTSTAQRIEEQFRSGFAYTAP